MSFKAYLIAFITLIIVLILLYVATYYFNPGATADELTEKTIMGLIAVIAIDHFAKRAEDDWL